MCSILLVFEKHNLNDPEATQRSQLFYGDLATLANNNKAIELLGENTLLIAIDHDSSLYMLHEILSCAKQHKQSQYKHAILPGEVKWNEVTTYHKNKDSLNAAFGR